MKFVKKDGLLVLFNFFTFTKNGFEPQHPINKLDLPHSSLNKWKQLYDLEYWVFVKGLGRGVWQGNNVVRLIIGFFENNTKTIILNMTLGKNLVVSLFK